MNYRVRYVSDDLLPAGHMWMLCRSGEDITLCIARKVRTMPEDEAEDVLSACWAGYREMVDRGIWPAVA